MKPFQTLCASALVLLSAVVVAAPAIQRAERTAPAGGANSNTTATARAASPAVLTAIKTTDVDASRGKAHVFRPANVARAIPEDQVDGPALVASSKLQKTFTVVPHLDVAKFGETVHSAFKDKVRGYALGLRKAGQPVLTLIWDWARTPEQGGKGWSLDTRMHLASVSKLLTAIGTTKMLSERGLSFDTKIGPYVPAYWHPGPNSNDLTFRELLTHQAAFTIYDGDYLSFKKQLEMGVSQNPADGIGYTNGSFSLIRVLNATMTGAVPSNAVYSLPIPLPSSSADAFNDAIWDFKTTEAFLAYMQSKVFSPSGVSGVATSPNATSALAYSGKSDTSGWDSGDVASQLGGAGFRLSANEVLDVMGTFRRKGNIVPASQAQASIEAKLGIDQVIDTPAGKLYNKNGAWRTGKTPTSDIEQCVAYYLPENMELVVLVNSWVGPEQASLRQTIANAYTASLK